MPTIGSRLRSLDLNLLPVLYELLRSHNVSRAAENLHMTQSAVSEALKRIRLQFGDEVLIRSGRGMIPTRLATQLLPHLERILKDLEGITHKHEVDLARIRREFTIATADVAILTLGEGLTRTLPRLAPGISIQFLGLQDFDPHDLQRGDVDFLIVPEARLPAALDNMLGQFLYQEEFVCIARGDRDDIGPRISRKALGREQQIAFRPDSRSPFSVHVDSARYWIPQLTLLPYLVSLGDAVAIVQRQIADAFLGKLNLKIIDLSFRTRRVDVYAYWSSVQDNDPEHKAFRNVLVELVPKGMLKQSAGTRTRDP
jgi:LysR family transcriptional regulator, nod-box dependent transcriptional activator